MIASAASFSDSANRADRQAFLGERGLGQLPGGSEGVDLAKASIQTLGLFLAPILETIGNGKSQVVAFPAAFESVARQQKIVKRAERAAAFDPNVARLQPFAQRGHHRDFIGLAVDAGICLYELAPYRPQKSRRRMRREFFRAARMKFAHHVERGK